jgi:WD40 repeat protein
MANLPQFRELVTICRKRQIDPATARPYTLAALAKAIGLSADELGHRLRGTGRSSLAKENVLAIVRTLAAWETLTWDEAVHLLTLMDYPLDPPDWRTELQRFLAPPPQLAHRVSRPSAESFPEHASASVRRRLFQAPDLPKEYVPRPKAFDEIKRLLLAHAGNQTTAITTALRGAGGFGKTTLASALCHDPDIQAVFPDGILWMELGEKPPQSLALLNELLHALEPSAREAITLEDARDRWRHAVGERAYLLVIDDVWQREALEEVMKEGPHCGRLITTRNDQILPDAAKRVWVDAMESDEAIELLCRGWVQDWQQTLKRSVLEQVAIQQLGCWPLLLTLARSMLTTQVKRLGKTPEQALVLAQHAYKDRGMVAFHLGDQIERQRSADVCLEVNLRQLEEWVPPRYQARQRYLELAVFPEDTNISLSTLQTYWQGTGGLHTWETEELCLRLSDLSLVLPWNVKHGTVRLHDVLRRYLIQQAGKHLPALHDRLLDAYQQAYGMTRWADLPQDEEYLWQHLILHLCQTNSPEALQTTLTDLSYLMRKALYVGVSALEADLMLASTWPSAQAAFPLVTELSQNIMRISHLLHQVQTEAEMGGLLLSYLDEKLVTMDQRRALERELPRPFLDTWHPLPNRASSALRRTLLGHTGWVFDCAVSADSSVIISASADQTLKVWDGATGAERLTLFGHTRYVTSCAVSADGRVIVSASDDHTLMVWDAISEAERLTLFGHTDGVNGCAVSADGRVIVSASDDQTLKVWDGATGAERLTLLGHTGRVTDCAVSADGRKIVSASTDQTLKVWDGVTGAERLTLSGHTNGVNGCAVSADGRVIVSASADQTLKVWDGVTGAERLTLSGHTDGIWGCAVNADGHVIVSASMDDTLKVWDGVTGAERLTLSGHISWVRGCAVSADGRMIVSASDDHTLMVWDATSETERLTLSDHTDRVNGCAVSADGRVIVSASDNHTLKVWDGATGAERLTLSGHTDRVNGCAVNADGRVIVSASEDRTLKVWDGVTGAERLSLLSLSGKIRGCAVSADGRMIVSAPNSQRLKVWDAATGTERLTLSRHTNLVLSCVVSADGRFVVSASRDSTLKVWDAATGAERLTLSGHVGAVRGCAVSADGRFIVSASDDCTLKVWDAATGAERLTLSGHVDVVRGCAVSADGRFIVSASEDRTLKVWSVQTGHCLLTFPVEGTLTGCAFHPDGEHLVACGDLGMYFLRLTV